MANGASNHRARRHKGKRERSLTPCVLGQRMPKPIDTEKIKKLAWLEDGILVVNPDTAEGIAWPDREHLRNIGNKLYGRRRP